MKLWTPGRICGLYLILMCSLFPLAFSPQGYRNIAETKFAVFLILTALFISAFLPFCFRRELPERRKPDAVRLLVLAYWGWSLLSALCSPWKRSALLGGERFEGMLTLTLSCAAFFLLSRHAGKTLFPLWIPAAALTVLCAVAVLQFFDLNPLRLYPEPFRWSGREKDYNGAFLSLIGNADLTSSVLCAGFALLLPVGLQKGKRLLLLPAFLSLGVMIASGIRAGLVGDAASVIIFLPLLLPLSGRGRRIVWGGLGLLCLGVLLLVYFAPWGNTAGELSALLHGRAEDSFGSGRIYIWRNVWKLIAERPLLGGGPDTLGERGLAFVKLTAEGGELRRIIDSAHCEALNILVNQGIPALLFLGAALTLTFRRVFRSAVPASLAAGSALLACIAASFFSVSMPANSAYFWLLWGVLLAETEKGAE